MAKQLFLLLILSSVLISCDRKDEVDTTIPRCISNLIDEFKKTASCNDAKVDQYIFQNQSVFVFELGSCGADLQAKVIDRNCNNLGSLGGVAGNTRINGDDFANAVFVRTVWEK
ncbi:MAG: hypothetical protein L3J06_05485 [Cyclobacteriaceae bacterium]|nr:hypothetical protein [Cyclobacteriaceae bacterium]